MSLGEKVLACVFTLFLVVLKNFKFFQFFSKKFFWGHPLDFFFFQSLKFHILIHFYDYHCFWTQKCRLEEDNGR